MLISQTLPPLDSPSLREALLFGGERGEWERIFDEAATFRHDPAVLRVLENEARREELRRTLERKLIRCAPAPVSARVGRPNAFRALFRKDIGGVAGESDSWFDASFTAVDGVSGKLQSYVDYVDNSHLLTQANTARQCALPAAGGTFANALVTTFALGVPSDYVSTRAASLWRYQSIGSATVVHVFDLGSEAVAPRYLSRTTTSGTNGVIFYAIRSLAPTMHSFRLFGGSPLDATVSADAGPTYVGYDLSPTAYSVWKKSTLAASGAATPPAGGPDLTFALSEFTQPFDGLHRGVYSFRHVLNASERIVFERRTQADTGITP